MCEKSYDVACEGAWHEDSEEIVSTVHFIVQKILNLKKIFALYGIRTQDPYVKFPSLY